MGEGVGGTNESIESSKQGGPGEKAGTVVGFASSDPANVAHTRNYCLWSDSAKKIVRSGRSV